MSIRDRPHGLRITVSLHGLVVGQTVYWPRRDAVTIGSTAADAVPTGSGEGLATATWRGVHTVALHPLGPNGPEGLLAPNDTLHWSNGAGVDVELDLVQQVHARRRASSGGGDVALLTTVLLLTVGVAQGRMLLERILPESGGVETVTEPSPELIARLLQRQVDGAGEGLPEKVNRPEHEEGAPSNYMPAGNDGDLARSGGGVRAGRQTRRSDPVEDEDRDGDALAEVEPVLSGDRPASPLSAPDPAPELLLADGSRADHPDRSPQAMSDPEERFVGWGFRDWFEVRDARSDTEREIARQLDMVRVRLAIDPNDPVAMQVLGYYAYLAENFDLGKQVYERYTRLYPDDPAGYNNLALVYKRTGAYAIEEALYRQALAMDPLDTHVLNNLAVNLAHQERYDEALRTMDLVDELDPEDPYAALHRAKILAAMGRREAAYRYLEVALDGIEKLDTMHHIEFRQDIRVDPAFGAMRDDRRFKRLLRRRYGHDADYLLEGRHTVRSARRWQDHG